MGVGILLGQPRGFLIPYRHAGGVAAMGRDSYPPAGRRLAAAEADFSALLAAAEGLAPALLAIGGAAPPQPRWAQQWFPRLDGLAAYVLVRERRPARIVEVGSGHSTRFLARAIADAGLATRLTAIDPAPRADLAGLAGRLPGMVLHRQTLQQAGLAPFAGLAAGDMVVIDSSHILMPGSDVDLLLSRVLPSLPAGVLVHVHDIFLPDGYPSEWAWRGYNEQPAVAALLGSGGWRPLWASHYVRTRMAGAVAAGIAGRLPLPEEAPESSLWLEKQ